MEWTPKLVATVFLLTFLGGLIMCIGIWNNPYVWYPMDPTDESGAGLGNYTTVAADDDGD